jgi:hypothetical protein
VKLTLFYASPAWSSCAANLKRRLQIMQNKGLKMILRDEADMATVVEYVGEVCQSFSGSLCFSQNPIIRNLAGT